MGYEWIRNYKKSRKKPKPTKRKSQSKTSKPQSKYLKHEKPEKRIRLQFEQVMSSNPKSKYYSKPEVDRVRQFYGAMEAHAYRNGLDLTGDTLHELYTTTDSDLLDRINKNHHIFFQYLPRLISPPLDDDGNIEYDDQEIKDWIVGVLYGEEDNKNPFERTSLDEIGTGEWTEEEEEILIMNSIARLEHILDEEVEMNRKLKEEIERNEREKEEEYERYQRQVQDRDAQEAIDRYYKQLEERIRNETEGGTAEQTKLPEYREAAREEAITPRNNPEIAPIPTAPREVEPLEFLNPDRRKRLYRRASLSPEERAANKADERPSFKFPRPGDRDPETKEAPKDQYKWSYQGIPKTGYVAKPRMPYGRINYRNYKVVEQHTQKLRNRHRENNTSIRQLKEQLNKLNGRLRTIRGTSRKKTNRDSLEPK